MARLKTKQQYNLGGTLGGLAGSALGTAIGGPVGTIAGKAIGTALGTGIQNKIKPQVQATTFNPNGTTYANGGTLDEFYTSQGMRLPSKAERKAIAEANGIPNYTGTAAQNARLLAILQQNFAQGRVNVQEGTTPTTNNPQYTEIGQQGQSVGTSTGAITQNQAIGKEYRTEQLSPELQSVATKGSTGISTNQKLNDISNTISQTSDLVTGKSFKAISQDGKESTYNTDKDGNWFRTYYKNNKLKTEYIEDESFDPKALQLQEKTREDLVIKNAKGNDYQYTKFVGADGKTHLMVKDLRNPSGEYKDVEYGKDKGITKSILNLKDAETAYGKSDVENDAESTWKGLKANKIQSEYNYHKSLVDSGLETGSTKYSEAYANQQRQQNTIPIGQDVPQSEVTYAYGGKVSLDQGTKVKYSPAHIVKRNVKGEDIIYIQDGNGNWIKSQDTTNNKTHELAQGGTIHIKPENRGKFNATKERTGKTTEELTHSKNPLTRKRAIFAQNAAKWKHADGGTINPTGTIEGDTTTVVSTTPTKPPAIKKKEVKPSYFEGIYPTGESDMYGNRDTSLLDYSSFAIEKTLAPLAALLDPEAFPEFKPNIKRPDAPLKNRRGMGQFDEYEPTNTRKPIGFTDYGADITRHATGGKLTKYEGNTHEQGGIALGNTNNEVEGGETRKEDYIFSDRLKSKTNVTFAKESKNIDNKYKRRPDDKMAAESKAKELEILKQKQEEVRRNMVDRAIKKAYGGMLNKYPNGGDLKGTNTIPIDYTPFSEPSIQLPDKTQYTNSYLTGAGDTTLSTFTPADQPILDYILRDRVKDVNTDKDTKNNKWSNLLSNISGLGLKQFTEDTSGNVVKTPANAQFAMTQLGNLYDIGRGLKGGSPVNVGRMSAIKSEQYDPTRAIQLQREAGMGANELYRQQGGQGLGTYLSNVGAQTGRTSADIGTTQSTYDQANVALRNAAAANRQTVQAQNIQLGMTEADLRQQEIDKAKNTLQTGLAGLSSGLAMKQLDEKLNTAQDYIIRDVIGTEDYKFKVIDSTGNSKQVYSKFIDGVERFYLVGTNNEVIEVDKQGNPINTTSTTATIPK